MEQDLYSQNTLQKHLNLDDTITAVERAFKSLARGQAQMPAKSYLQFEKHNGDLRTMPAYVPSFEYATVKIVNAHPDNPSKFSLPTVMALLVAVDPGSGRPEAVMDGTSITSKRTAAASALATERFTPDHITTLGFLGTGSQARDQLEGQLLVREFSEVLLFDKNDDNAQNFKQLINEAYPSLEVVICDEAESIVERSDTVVSLTPSESPLVQKESIPDGLHINAMGADAPDKREWPDSILEDCEIIVDSWAQASHSGEISQFVKQRKLQEKDIGGTLGELLNNSADFSEPCTIFDSTGLAIQDTAAANAFLEQDPEPDATFDFLNLNLK